MRAWIGTAGLALVGIVVSLLGPAASLPVWLTLVIIVVSLGLAVLMVPVKVQVETAVRSTFIKGNFKNSSMKDIQVTGADDFITGDVEHSTLARVIFRGRRRR